jgi:primary-amine oxidase
LGTKNTLAKHEVRAVQQECSWSNYTRSTMKLFRSDIATEDDGKLSWHDGAMYIVENKDEKNKYGEYRGWRVKPGLGMGHRLTMTNSSNLFDSQNFATHHLYVTKQSDNEPHCAHANNNYDTRNPIVDFNKFFDGESLEQEDLVLWVNLGMTHVPHTGDLPNTVFNTAQSSVQ